MIAIVNSLSMYATHPDSDIDLFIVAKPWMIWFVRFFSTLILWKRGVWRKGEDIAGNLCLSFFITTEAMNLQEIAIENDIYLYYWIYYMKPVFVRNNTYEKFIEANNWVEIDENQKIENMKFLLPWIVSESFFMRIFRICRAIFSVKLQRFWILQFRKKSSDTDTKIQHRSQKTFGTFGHKSTWEKTRLKKFLWLLVIKLSEIYLKKKDLLIRWFWKRSLQDDKKIYENAFGTFSIKSTRNDAWKIYEDPEINSELVQSEAWEWQKHIKFYKKINQIIRFFLLPQTLGSKWKLWNPEWIIISDMILKFHDTDRRKEIRNTILKNNFDK